MDDLRAAYPDLGFAVYALDPNGLVTLEVLGLDGNIYTFTGPTERAAITMAFPPREEPPEPEPPTAPALPSSNVFD